MKNVPKRIYLNLGDGVPDDADFRDLEEVTWSEERISDSDIEYAMPLQDFTSDELRAELKRRAAEARKAANTNRDRKPKYLSVLFLVFTITLFILSLWIEWAFYAFLIMGAVSSAYCYYKMLDEFK